MKSWLRKPNQSQESQPNLNQTKQIAVQEFVPFDKIDLPSARNQAVVLKRINERLHKYAFAEMNGIVIDYVDHFNTEINYLLDYLGIPKEDR